ncbi:MAG: hypothetical protein K6E12_05980 [Saccharofermentans sp.]|nr:hypothetical protein [Saccharofermentans sp.]
MKNINMTKALSAGLCVAMGFSCAACGYPDDTRPYETEAEETTAATSAEETTTETASTVTEISEETAATSVEIAGNPYESFIEGYKDAIINRTSVWYYGPDIDPNDLSVDYGQGLIVDEMSDYMYYTLYDLDKDGVEELIIGCDVTGDHMQSCTMITGIVTLEGSAYKIVAAGWSRSSLEYVGEGYFVNSGSGGAFLHYDAVFRYDGAAKELATVGVLVTEYSETEDIFYSYFDSIDKAYAAYPAYGNENAICFDEEAQQKYDNDLLTAQSKTNELIGVEWQIVDLHDL